MPFPLNKWFLKVCHGVHDQLHKATIKNAAFIPDIVIVEEVSYLSLAVGAWSTDVFFDIR